MSVSTAKRANGTAHAFRRLTRGDLTSFDREAKDLILEAIDAGCVGRVSARGHCILRNNAGGTASIPRKLTSANRTAQNCRADMRRLLAEHHQEQAPTTSLVRSAATITTTVSRAFVDYGAPFSRWFDQQSGGLSADDQIAVGPGPTFSRLDETASPTETEQIRTESPMTQPTTGNRTGKPRPVSTLPDAEEMLQRVREVLDEDPETTELKRRIQELEQQLEDEKTRANEAEARIAIIQDALKA